MNAEGALTWERPGPGSWTYDGAHNTGPVTRLVQQVYPGAMAEGFRSFTGRYGLPVSHIDIAYVNGYAYSAVRVAGVPVTDRPPPPTPVLRLVSRVLPELRRRNRAAVAAVRTRPWRADLDHWFAELRSTRLEMVRSIQAVDPFGLTDAGLADHLDACVRTFRSGLRVHFGLVGAAGLPVGLHLQREADRGRSVADALGDLRGAAASSTSATVPALAAIADALADAGTAEPASFADIRQASPRAAAALDAYLDEYGQRVVGAFDITGKRLIESPELVLRSIAAAGGTAVAKMPASDDVIVEDARLAIASRDDHAGICCMWPLGLVRRAVLATAERLAADGRLVSADLAFEADSIELDALLRRDASAPSSAALDARRASRRRAAEMEPPATLGPTHVAPDPAALPTGLRTLSAAMGAFVAALETVRTGDRDGTDTGIGSGIGIGSDRYRGRAVVAADPEDALARLQPGDVLVTATTTPAFNTVLVLAGALVTAHGGPMSHAGIVARELHIPAVLGLAGVLDRIPDGAEVEVDPVAATVEVVTSCA